MHGLYMPSLGIDSPGHIVFAIDTSGSMSSSEELADNLGELRAGWRNQYAIGESGWTPRHTGAEPVEGGAS